MSDPQEPIRLPQPDTPIQEDTVAVSQASIYYFLVGAIFFIAGFIVAWVVFSTTQSPIAAADLRSAASDGARTAVRAEMQSLQATVVAIAASGGGGIAPTAAPPSPVSIDLGTSPAWGPEDAPVTIVEFSDFQCSFCARFYAQTYPLIREEYGDRVRFVFKHYPISGLHPDAEPAAMASECANEQGLFWEYHDLLFENQRDLSGSALLRYAEQAGVPDMAQFSECVASQRFASTVMADLLAGDRLGVTGTPTFFINGLPLVGAHPYQTFRLRIEQALAEAGQGS
jgi:protein-disulfide isomerase